MKKTKLLMPLAGIAAIGAVAPIAIMTTSCNKGGDKKEDVIVASEADKKFLTEINTYMGMKSGLITPYKAITTLKDLGVDVLSFQLSRSELQFAFDAGEKRFIIMHNDDVLAKPADYTMSATNLVFKFTSSYDKTSKYGQYLLDNFVWTDSTAVFEIGTSVDVGNNTHIKNMKYVGGSTNDTNKEVMIRSYCESLEIPAAGETVYHAGVANNLKVSGTTGKVCEFTEVGKVGYLDATYTKISFARLDKVNSAEVDWFNAGTGVTVGTWAKGLVPYYTGTQISGVTSETSTFSATTDVADAAALVTAFGTAGFHKLSADIVLDTNTAAKLSVTVEGVMLNLAGKSITDNAGTGTIGVGTPIIDITPTDQVAASLSIFNSGKTGAINLKDHTIGVSGRGVVGPNGEVITKNASLYLEGVNIIYVQTNTAGQRDGAITVGLDETAATLQKSKCYMFGGTITCTAQSAVTDTAYPTGIYANNNAYIQIIYGEISSPYCCVRGNGRLDNSYIDLLNSKLTVNNKTIGVCVYMPQGGKLNVVGGEMVGHCCIGVRDGDINISGGYLHATGDAPQQEIVDPVSSSGIRTDGSVICVELTDQPGYGANPCITITDASLQSDKCYIMNIFQQKTGTTEYPFTGLFEVDFFRGMYYYAKDASGSTYDGVRVATSTIQPKLAEHCRINQYGGSWIKTA